MLLGQAQAPGKIILFGEHAVVFGRPALAVPVTQVQAEAIVEAAGDAGTTIWAEDLAEHVALADAPADHPLAVAVRLAFARLGLADPAWRIIVRSTIPIASGMGSGAAVSAAIIRAIADAAASRQSSVISGQSSAVGGQPSAVGDRLSPSDVSALVYEVDKLHHGTPSGVDNTVIAYGQPVYFARGQPPQPFPIGQSFWIAIADTGIHSPTKITVGDVRRAWQQEPARYEALFDRIAAVVEAAHTAIAAGRPDQLGPLMDQNHALLQALDVSCPELDALVAAARAAGAAGAKLSGGGRGGNMIALVTDATAAAVADALVAAGAVRVIVTQVGADAS